jgi:hypothetical protein
LGILSSTETRNNLHCVEKYKQIQTITVDRRHSFVFNNIIGCVHECKSTSI